MHFARSGIAHNGLQELNLYARRNTVEMFAFEKLLGRLQGILEAQV